MHTLLVNVLAVNGEYTERNRKIKWAPLCVEQTKTGAIRRRRKNCFAKIEHWDKHRLLCFEATFAQCSMCQSDHQWRGSKTMKRKMLISAKGLTNGRNCGDSWLCIDSSANESTAAVVAAVVSSSIHWGHRWAVSLFSTQNGCKLICKWFQASTNKSLVFFRLAKSSRPEKSKSRAITWCLAFACSNSLFATVNPSRFCGRGKPSWQVYRANSYAN